MNGPIDRADAEYWLDVLDKKWYGYQQFRTFITGISFRSHSGRKWIICLSSIELDNHETFGAIRGGVFIADTKIIWTKQLALVGCSEVGNRNPFFCTVFIP